MLLDLIARRKWMPPVVGALIFLTVFVIVFCLTLPREAILGWLAPTLEKNGVRLEAQNAGMLFPAGISLDNALVVFPGKPDGFVIDRFSARVDLLWLFRGLPIHLRAERGLGFVDFRLSSLTPNAGKGRFSASNISSNDLQGLLPGNGPGLAIDRIDVAWSASGNGFSTGKGQARFSGIKLPIPAADSPVREALIRDALVDFTLQGGGLHISSLKGKYEGSPVEGTGEIAHIGTPSRSTITFHLKIANPYEGNVASIFNLVSKNAKNANLRIYGPLLSPAGEFQFF